MAPLHLALLYLTAGLVAPGLAQDNDFTIWSSFIYLRSGERTPTLLSNFAPTLTSLGAQQMFSAGQFFRSQYLQQGSASRIQELDEETPRTDQVYSLTIDTQFTSASTQAFMLGMWPPTGNNASADTEGIPNQLVNGTIINNPQGGMNLPRISTAGTQDIDAVYVGGDIACPGFGRYASNPWSSDTRSLLISESQPTYDSIQSILDPILPRTSQNFQYAKTIYDYVSYENNYNRNVSSLLSTDSTILDRLRFYADAQQTAFYGNLNAASPYSRAPLWATRGSISTIAGSTLAARLTSHFYSLQYAPATAPRLTILAGDHAPLLSLFALTSLTPRLPGLALPGSALVFELISRPEAAQNLTAANLPPPDELFIRARFRNGTGVSGTATFPGSGGDLRSYALFDRASEDINIPYNDFLAAMGEISISGPGDWCYQCAAQTLFCAAWNSSNAFTGAGTARTVRVREGLRPEVAGVVGAVVALVVAGIVAAIVFFVVGFSVRRTEPVWVSRRRRQELGGFKGSQKLASDRDLTASVPHVGKDGVVVGASVEKTAGVSGGDGHVRMGSWEMKDGAGSGMQTQNEVGGMKPWAQRHGRVDSEGTLVDRDMGHMGLDGARMGWGSRDEGDHVAVARQGDNISTVNEREERRISADSGHVDPFRDPVSPIREDERV